jgi:PIN domain nuclease of toxin-antitoxin system
MLPISADHAIAATALPLHHRDPFDRMLIGQALVEGLTVMTRDRDFGAYDVRVETV